MRPDPSAVYYNFLGITYFSRSCRPCIQMCSCICSHVCHTENQSMFLHFYKVSPYTSPLRKIRTAQVRENQEELEISFSLRVLYVVAEGKLHSLLFLLSQSFPANPALHVHLNSSPPSSLHEASFWQGPDLHGWGISVLRK